MISRRCADGTYQKRNGNYGCPLGIRKTHVTRGSSGEVRRKTWKDSSVHILLNGLLQKEAIQEAGLVKRSKTYGRVFSPTMTREEYFASTIFSHRHKPNLVELIKALLSRNDVTQNELDEITAFIAKKNL